MKRRRGRRIAGRRSARTLAGFLTGLFLLAGGFADASDASGREVYEAHCAACHGPEGGGFIGPPIIGPDAALANYKNARKLFDYIRSVMPQNNPGSLTEPQYLHVLAYLLVGNGIIDTERRLDKDELSTLKLR